MPASVMKNKQSSGRRAGASMDFAKENLLRSNIKEKNERLKSGNFLSSAA